MILKRYFTILAATSLWAICLVVATSPALADRVVATGNGVAVWERDVQATREYMNSLSIHAADNVYIQEAVKYVLFEIEALELNLQPSEFGAGDDAPAFTRRLALADAYIQHVIRDTPLDLLIVESYYFAFPERFDGNQHVDEQGEHVMPKNIAQDIRQFILYEKRREIMAEAHERLMQKYGMDIREQTEVEQ